MLYLFKNIATLCLALKNSISPFNGSFNIIVYFFFIRIFKTFIILVVEVIMVKV